MRRTPLWAAIAFLPLIVTAIGGSAPESWNTPVVDQGALIEFLTSWWWALIATPAVAVWLYFFGHALWSVGKAGLSRALWAVSMLALGPLVAPVYWWKYSDAT
jgi:hypothetical protein